MQKFKNKIIELKQTENFRKLPEKISNNLINLCSNDYLGLNNDKKLYDDFLTLLYKKNRKFSSCSSRLLSGNSIEHYELEELIASKYKSQACLLYNSGYHANVGILSALAEKKDLIISDKLIHASLIDGIRLSKATVARYKHSDYFHLEKILLKSRDDFENVFIVSESIFSMDGDTADLKKLIELKNKYKCFLYIDEAHAVGVRGKNGLGYAEELGVKNEIDFIIGTFGKAMASIGAYVVCNNIFKQYLVNHSRTLIYTTALPPVNLAWSKYIFEQLHSFNDRRKKLEILNLKFAKLLNLDYRSHIIPYIIGSNKDAIKASENLKQQGLYVLPVRYPTVPKGTARLRFTLNANMDFEKIKHIKTAINKK